MRDLLLFSVPGRDLLHFRRAKEREFLLLMVHKRDSIRFLGQRERFSPFSERLAENPSIVVGQKDIIPPFGDARVRFTPF